MHVNVMFFTNSREQFGQAILKLELNSTTTNVDGMCSDCQAATNASQNECCVR